MKGEETRLNRWVSFSIYIYASGCDGMADMSDLGSDA